MCGCSSNFDGHSDLEEIEETKYLDFDGEDDMDDDFEDFFGKKAKARRQVRKTNRATKKATKFSSYDDCMAKKPLLVSKNVWVSTCDKQFPAPAEEEEEEEINSVISSPAIKKMKQQMVESAKVKGRMIIDENLKSKEPIVSSSNDEPKIGGIMANKKVLMIFGGLAVLGLGIFAYKKLKK